MKIELNFPNGITTDEFLRDYWQKKPLYIPNALTGFTDPLEPEELAGLACEDEIAARIILNEGNNDWQVRHNPFSEDDFTGLPETHWTVLVQDLNKHIRELDLLLEAFDFLPSWRIDDVMASYAAPYGGVGPHTDQYDVFLLQGIGTRRWQICSEQEDQELIEGIDVRILKHFNAEQEFLLQPGDMLYLPPGEQHFGESDEACMTYSIGLRAPTQLEFLGDYIDQLTLRQNNSTDTRYRDPTLTQQQSGEISKYAMDEIISLIRNIPDNETEIKHWFGKFITSTHQTLNSIPLEPSNNQQDTLKRIQTGDILYRNPTSRFAYIDDCSTTFLYIDSCAITVSHSMSGIVKHICNHRQFSHNDLSDWLENKESLALILAWIEIGLLEFSNND